MSSVWVDLLGAEVRFVKANGIRTRVIEAGSGPALLLLHGGGGHAETYARNVVPLSKKYRVVAIDYLGHGLTDYTRGWPSADEFARHIVGVMDALGIEKAALGGESFGGTLSFTTARKFPERVSHMIAIVGGMFAVGADEASVLQWDTALTSLVARQRAFVANPSREAVQKRLAWLFHEPEKMITEELVDIRWKFYQRDVVRRMLADMADRIEIVVGARPSGFAGIDPAEPLRPMTPDDLRAFKHKTLFVWTDHNPSLTAATARTAAGFIPDCRFELMNNCGHWPQWEDPATFNAIIESFLG